MWRFRRQKRPVLGPCIYKYKYTRWISGCVIVAVSLSGVWLSLSARDDTFLSSPSAHRYYWSVGRHRGRRRRRRRASGCAGRAETGTPPQPHVTRGPWHSFVGRLLTVHLAPARSGPAPRELTAAITCPRVVPTSLPAKTLLKFALPWTVLPFLPTRL